MQTHEAQKSQEEVARLLARQATVGTREVARLLGVEQATVLLWDWTGKLTPFLRTGGHRRYLLSDVQAFLERLKGESK
jgi:excisionase family DNA binding protein